MYTPSKEEMYAAWKIGYEKELKEKAERDKEFQARAERENQEREREFKERAEREKELQERVEREKEKEQIEKVEKQIIKTEKQSEKEVREDNDVVEIEGPRTRSAKKEQALAFESDFISGIAKLNQKIMQVNTYIFLL